jgi:hypothetical protein
MKISQLGTHLRTVLCVVFVFVASTASAVPMQIGFTGMNLVYDGSAIYDAGSTTGGTLDPADGDSLVSLDFIVGGSPVGSISSDIAIDLFVPDVVNIPAAANTVFNVTTPGNPGYLDILIGTSPSAAQYLALDLDEVNVTYVDVSGIVQFNFVGAVASGSTQNLPFGLQIGDPITLSLAAQVAAGTKTTAGGFITGFSAAGTGEISGEQIPEPSSIALAGLGILAIPAYRRLRRK